MQVTVEGFNDKDEIRLLRDFTYFCAETLCDDDEIIDGLTVKVKKDIALLADKRWGDATVNDLYSDAPRNFTVRLVGRHGEVSTMVHLLRVHAHEMTHIKQMSMNQLQFMKGTQVFWEGKILDSAEIMDWFEPWEVEARGYEKALVELFCRERGYLTATWYQPLP